MSLSTLLALASITLTAGPSQVGSNDVFQSIDARYSQGTIDAGTRQLYRVAAVRRPELLPPALRSLVGVPGAMPRRSVTPIFLEAMRWVRDNDAQGGELHQLLMPPDDLPHVIESITHPIRVSYTTPSQATLAQLSLQYAEISWDVLTQQYGFWEPSIEPGSVQYRIYIDSTNGSGAAYTAPYEENTDTPHMDYYSYIVVDPQFHSEWNISGTIAHEFTHACQSSMDILEPTAFWENTATYIQSRVFPDQLYFTVSIMYLFQEQPWRALDYMNTLNSDAYEYGGALFVWYLADTFAPTAPAQFVGEIWQESVQTTMANEPDYFDAIETVVAARGFERTMEEILLDFSEARFFVGSRDDGEHITNAYQFEDAEVVLAAQYSHMSLPLKDESVLEQRWPAAFGSNHVLVNLPVQYTDPIVVSFNGADETHWGVRVLLIEGGSGTEATELVLDAETGDGSVVVEPNGHRGLLLVVANYGAGDYDPDQYNMGRPWPTSEYLFSVEPVVPPASNLSLEPAEVERGQQDVALELHGTGFASGEAFNLEFTDPNVQIVSIDWILPTQVSFKVTVPLLTELGEKDLIVTNRDGQQTTATGILTIIENSSVKDGEKPGCSCRSGGATPLAGLPILLALLFLGLRRRR